METVRAIQESGKIKKRTDIFKGVKDLAQSKDEAYHTLDPTHPTFRDLGDSINQRAGAEYSYNFWMFLKSPNNNVVFGSTYEGPFETDNGLTAGTKVTALPTNKPLVLLLRGDKKTYVYKNLCSTQETPKFKEDVLVKNPMIKLENGGDIMSVEINTVSAPDGVQERARDTCGELASTEWDSVNKHRVAVKGFLDREELRDKWFMVTLVVQDTFPTDPLPLRNKVRVRLYVNGVMEIDKYLDGKLSETSTASTVLKQNNGNLFVAPVIKSQQFEVSYSLDSSSDSGKVRMADLAFFNYALDVNDLSDLFSSGFTKQVAAGMTNNGMSSGAALVSDMSFASNESILTPV